LIDRETLGRAEHRRGLESAVQDVGLERIRQRVIDVDAADPGVQGIDEAGSAVLRQVACVKGLHISGHLVDVYRHSRHGRGADDHDLVNRPCRWARGDAGQAAKQCCAPSLRRMSMASGRAMLWGCV